MIEGGSSVRTAFLSQSLADELHLAIAPLIVGQTGAPPFLNPGVYLGGPRRRTKLAEVIPVGDMVMLRYLPNRSS